MAIRKVTTPVLVLVEPPTNENSSWGAIVPLIPGCHSTGDSRQELLTNVLEAIESHTELEPADADVELNDHTAIDLRQFGEDLEPEDVMAKVWVNDLPSAEDHRKALLEKITYKIPRVAVGAIIINPEGHILMCRRPKGPENYVGKLHTFGGKVDLGENLYDAIVREVKEECAIDVKIAAFNMSMAGMIEEIEPECSHVYAGANHMYHWVSAIWVFNIKSDDFKNMEPEKHLEMGWYDLSDVDRLDIAPSAYHSLVLAGLLEPIESNNRANLVDLYNKLPG